MKRGIVHQVVDDVKTRESNRHGSQTDHAANQSGDNLAEREGFEPSIQVLARITV